MLIGEIIISQIYCRTIQTFHILFTKLPLPVFTISGRKFKIKFIYRFAQNIKTNILEILIICSCIYVDYTIITKNFLYLGSF